MRATAIALVAAALAAPVAAQEAGPVLRLLDSLPAAGWGEGNVLSWFDYVDLRLVEKMVGLPNRSAWPADEAAARDFTDQLGQRLGVAPGLLASWWDGSGDPLATIGLAFATVDRMVALEAGGRSYVLMAGEESLTASGPTHEALASFEPGIFATAGDNDDYQALAGIAAGAALSLAGIPDVQAAIRAVERQTPAAGAVIQLQAFAPGPDGFAPILPEDAPLDDRALPQPSLIVIADRQEATRAVGLLALPYPDRATAQAALDIVASRAFAWEPLPEFIHGTGAELPIEIVDTGPDGRAVVLIGLSRPGRVKLEDGGFGFWRRQLIVNFDHRLLAP